MCSFSPYVSGGVPPTAGGTYATDCISPNIWAERSHLSCSQDASVIEAREKAVTAMTCPGVPTRIKRLRLAEREKTESAIYAECRKQKRKRWPWTTPWTCGGSIPPLGSKIEARVMISASRLAELNTLIVQGEEHLFYTWSDWLRVRGDVLKLDNYECQRCKARGRYSKAIIVHHIKHLKDRPDLALSIYDGKERQLISLCRACHEAEHPERGLTPRQGHKHVTDERWD